MSSFYKTSYVIVLIMLTVTTPENEGGEESVVLVIVTEAVVVVVAGKRRLLIVDSNASNETLPVIYSMGLVIRPNKRSYSHSVKSVTTKCRKESYYNTPLLDKQQHTRVLHMDIRFYR
uniref:Secreted protein n=1 Tax=Vespula pensylvanica TaxID=30213 RepID=A0A834U5C4_VESPE|nr:hypothetical protein H0235_011772 [Vespula pensylvanica]